MRQNHGVMSANEASLPGLQSLINNLEHRVHGKEMRKAAAPVGDLPYGTLRR